MAHKRSASDRDDDLSTALCPPSKKQRYNYDMNSTIASSPSPSISTHHGRLPRTVILSDDESVLLSSPHAHQSSLSDHDIIPKQQQQQHTMDNTHHHSNHHHHDMEKDKEKKKNVLLLPATMNQPIPKHRLLLSTDNEMEQPQSLPFPLPLPEVVDISTLNVDLDSNWNLLNFVRNRLYGDICAEHSVQFINELPWHETKFIMDKLVHYRYSALTYLSNIWSIVCKMKKLRDKAHECVTLYDNADRAYYNLPKDQMQRMRQFVCSYDKLSQSFDLKCKSEDVSRALQSFAVDLQSYRTELAQYGTIDAQYRRLYHTDEEPRTAHSVHEEQHEHGHGQRHGKLATTTTTTTDNHHHHHQEHKHHQNNNRKRSHGPHHQVYAALETSTEDDHESDEDYVAGTTEISSAAAVLRPRKNQKLRKQKREQPVHPHPHKHNHNHKKQSDGHNETEEEMWYHESKNPVHKQTNPEQFWKKFNAMVEPVPATNAASMQSLFHALHADAYPVNIPDMPTTASGHANENENALFDDNNTASKTASEKHGMDGHDDDDKNALYFAEIAKPYEYVPSGKGHPNYAEQQSTLEDASHAHALRRHSAHQQFPHRSLFAHSMHQRLTSSLVHECRGMYDIEHDVNENHWRRIGDARFETNDVHTEHTAGGSGSTSSSTSKRSSSKQERPGAQYDPRQVIEPEIRYMSSADDANTNTNTNASSYETMIRHYLCKHVYNSDAHEFGKIVRLPWQQRTDDEVCATIKSLQSELQLQCYTHGYNELETNVKIANELIDTVSNEIDRNVETQTQTPTTTTTTTRAPPTPFRQFRQHLAAMQQFEVINGQTLRNQDCAQHIQKLHEQLPPLEQIEASLRATKHVQTLPQ